MIKNYFKIAWRSLVTSRLVSFINIAGLAVGMAVAMLIGLWVWDEASFDRQCGNYDRIAQVMENQYINGSYGTQKQLPIPVAGGLSAKFGSNFKRVVLSSMTGDHILAVGDKNCMDSADLSVFSLSDSTLEFMDNCEFPHIIRAISPDYSLRYTYTCLAAFLKPEFRKRLILKKP